MASLYQMTEEMIQLLDWLDEDPGNEAIETTISMLKEDIETKAEGYCYVIRTLQDRMEAIHKEEERLKKIKWSAESSIDRLKKALFNAMKACNKEKMESGLFKLSIRNNAVSLSSIPGVEELPEKYRIKQEDKVDRRLLLDDVKSGVEVPGVTTAQTQSLIIR